MSKLVEVINKCNCAVNDNCSICRTEEEENQYWSEKLQDLLYLDEEERGER